jgi:hypothetical protein
MSIPEWFIEGRSLVHCSCDYGCPCDANAPPTHGTCEGVMGLIIDEGYFGDVRLDGLKVAATYHFPRAIHHGGGHMQPILEEHTNEAQRNALFTILSGEGQPAGTMFQIFSIIVDHHHEPLFMPFDLEIDMQTRRGNLSVPGIVRSSAEPILNPVTDEEHRMLTVLPNAFMFYAQDIVSGDAKGLGNLKFDYASRHAAVARFAYNNNGLAYSFDEHVAKYGIA